MRYYDVINEPYDDTIPINLNLSTGETEYGTPKESTATTASQYVYGLIFLIGLFGNVWVVVFIRRKNLLRRPVTNILMVNLSMADLFIIVFLPIIIAEELVNKWTYAWVVCKFYYTFDNVNKFACAMFITLLSVDRYFTVCHPVLSRSVRTVPITYSIAVVTWALVSGFSSPTFVYATVSSRNNETQRSPRCVLTWYNEFKENEKWQLIYIVYSFLFSYLIPLVVIWTLYLLIWNGLRQREQVFVTVTLNNPESSQTTTLMSRHRSSCRISVMVLTIVIAYTLCWMPYWTVQFLQKLFPDYVKSFDESFVTFSLIASGLRYVNSAVNPYLYAIGVDSYRREHLRFTRSNASTTTYNDANHDDNDSLSSSFSSFRSSVKGKVELKESSLLNVKPNRRRMSLNLEPLLSADDSRIKHYSNIELRDPTTTKL